MKYDKKKPDVSAYLVFSIQGWSEMWVSKHWISAALAKNASVYFVEPFRGLFLPGRGGRILDLLFGPSISIRHGVHVVSFTSLPFYYRLPGFFRAIWRLFMRRQFSNFRRRLSAGDFDIINFDYRAAPIFPLLPKARKNLYYAIDRIPEKHQDSWYPESRLIKDADIVIAISERHRDRVAASTGRHDIEVIPHGIDFSSVSVAKKDAVGSFRHGYDAVIGYTGSIHDLYVDFPVVAAVVKKHSKYHFVFVGPYRRSELGAGSSENVDLIRNLPNVTFTGQRAYQDLADIISQFDVCLMPYHPSVDNEPFKTLQYFAQGKPVVATNVVGISEYRELVYTCSGAEEMARKIDEALAECGESSLRKSRVEYARQRDFNVIIDKIRGALR